MAARQIHVTPIKNSVADLNWRVSENENGRSGIILAACRTKRSAVRIGRALARENKGSLYIHVHHNGIQVIGEERSYGNETKRPG